MRGLVRLADREASHDALAGELPCAVDFDFSGVPFEVRSTSDVLPRYLDRVYAFFRAPTGARRAAARRLFAVERGTAAHERLETRLESPRPLRGHVLAVDWFGWALVLADATLLNYYASKLLRLAVVDALSVETVTLHAATVVRDGVGALMIGEAAAGKTSLTLRLIEHGFRYGADDTTPLRRRDGRCLPFPTPFIVRADEATGRPPLRDLDDRDPDIALLNEPRWLVERWSAVAGEFAVTHLLFLDAALEPPGCILPMRPVDAALELLRNTVLPLGADLNAVDLEQGHLETYIDLATSARCSRVGSGDVDLALASVLTLLGSPTGGTDHA